MICCGHYGTELCISYGESLNKKKSNGYNLCQVVVSCVEGSPADRAGIQAGDELVEIDGKCLCVFS